MDWVLYVLSFVFVLDLCIKFETAGCEGQQCWQWPVGSFLVTVAWLNFLKNFRYVPYFGIFILMINYIIHTVAKFAVILVIFIVAFALGFHILFINQVLNYGTSNKDFIIFPSRWHLTRLPTPC